MFRYRLVTTLSVFLLLLLSVPMSTYAGTDSWSKHNKKLAELEQKRQNEREKINRQYRKMLETGDPDDVRKLQKLQMEYHKKLHKIEQEYFKELEKLERKQNQARR